MIFSLCREYAQDPAQAARQTGFVTGGRDSRDCCGNFFFFRLCQFPLHRFHPRLGLVWSRRFSSLQKDLEDKFSPSFSFSLSAISLFMKLSCCIQGALITTTVRTPLVNLDGWALEAIWLPTTFSQTRQISTSPRSLFQGPAPECVRKKRGKGRR